MKAAAPKNWNLRRFDVRAFADAGARLEGTVALAELDRLSEECHPQGGPVAPVQWVVQGELRLDASGRPAVWLRLEAHLDLPVTCQRCLGPVPVPLTVDRWFRFVDDEATAEAQDEISEEDVLALEPRPDLLALMEDELLMELPLVPMHTACPEPLSGAREDAASGPDEPVRPNPFAALAKLRP